MDLFLHKSNGMKLEDFYQKVFDLFNIDNSEERDSSNYPPLCRYFIGYGTQTHFKLWDIEPDILGEYPFVLSIGENSYKYGSSELPNDIFEIAEILAKNEVNCFVPAGDYWDINWNGEGQTFRNPK